MRYTTLFVAWLIAAAAHAESETERQVKKTVIDNNTYAIEQMKTDPAIYSKLGALEFWSSGGLLQEIPASGGAVSEFLIYTIIPKHIRVVTLVEDQAAVAHYYLEGAEQYVGQPVASNYLTRVSQAFVKEDGLWKVRSSHYSRIIGGEGTTLTAPQ
jgi:hypothetical protein